MDRLELLITARNQASGPLKESARDVAGVGSAADKASKGTKSLADQFNGLKTAIGALGALAFVQQLYSMASGLGQAALQLEKFRSTARLLAGDQARYNDVIAIARQNQVLFGGDLGSSIQGLGLLASQARKSGIELATLNDLSQRLNLISPEQGLEGAAIALREAFSGDTQSLVERFELPRQELAKLRDTSITAAQRVEILNKVLDAQGVKAGDAAKLISETAKAYNDLGRAGGDLGIIFGQRIATAFEDAARGLTRITDSAINTVISIFTLADALKSGMPIFQALNYATGEGANKYREQLGLLPGVTDATSAQAAAAREGAAAAQAQASAIAQTIAKQQDSALASARQKDIETELHKVAADVAQGFYLQSDAAAYLAAKYPELGAGVEGMIAKQIALASAVELAASRMAEQAGHTKTLGVATLSSPGRQGNGDSDIARVAEMQQKAREEADALAAANRRNAYSNATAAGQIKILRAELAKLTPGTAAYVDKLTEVQTAESALARTRATSGQKAAAANDKTLETIEKRTEEHYQRLRRAAEDYETSASRSKEDYDRQRIKLLAEGKRKEADLLTEDFTTKQRRAAEDFAKSQARTREDGGIVNADASSTGRTGARVLPGGVLQAGSGGGAAPAAAQGTPAGAQGSILNVNLVIDGKQFAQATIDDIEALLVAGAAVNIAASPPRTGATYAAGGPRP